MTRKKILIIEDDPAIAEIERDFLEIENFETHLFPDGESGLQAALGGGYDLVLLDLMLPGVDGYAICKKIRAALDIPVLMVTAKMEDADKIRGLGLGADDFITKPFSPSELVARVKANLAQYARLIAARAGHDEVARENDLCAAHIRVNPAGRRVFVDGREVEMTNKEYELLLFLMRSPDTVFSKDALYERVWGPEAYGDLKTVAVHINRLREKVEKDPARPVHIQTVFGAGYRFSA